MTVRVQSILLPASFFLFSLLLQNLSAESFPPPSGDEKVSLLGIVTAMDTWSFATSGIPFPLEGPESHELLVEKKEWNIRWFRVQPGTYSLESSSESVVFNPGGIEGVVNVLPGTVVLAAFRVSVFISEEKP
jgi:hypothetical protein